MKHYKWTALCLVLLLTLSCFLTACSDAVGSPATEPESTQAQQKQEAENDDGADKDGEPGTVTGGASDADDAAGSEDTARQPDAQEPQTQTCTISIDCSTILDNMDKLERGKEGLIPSDGILLAKTEVQYEEGDTVFTMLKRELKSRKMHYDFEGSGSSAYLAGLCNIYEFDCGKLSGWEFAVNGSFPSVGMGVYKLSPGDSVALIYTCDLGDDIGNHYDG